MKTTKSPIDALIEELLSAQPMPDYAGEIFKLTIQDSEQREREYNRKTTELINFYKGQ